MEPRYYLWIDIETTGLDPQADNVLELAMFSTDARLEIVPGSELEVVFPYREPPLGSMTDYVRRMHTDNGLLAECARVLGSGLFPGDVWDEVAKRFDNVLGSLVVPRFDALAGSSVHFDRGFLAHHAPDLLYGVSHRNVDVSSFQLALGGIRSGLVPPKEESNHRAMPDLKRSLSAMRKMMRNIGVLP